MALGSAVTKGAGAEPQRLLSNGLCLVNKRRSASALEQTQDMSITANQEIQPLREAWVERESPKPQLGSVPACLSQLWHRGPVTHPYTVSCR